MIMRLAVLAALLVGAWLFVGWWERRKGAQAEGVAPGVTMFTTDECRMCPLAVQTLAGAGVPVTIRSALDPMATLLSVRSVPTVVVADAAGQVTLRRSGRAVVSDVNAIAAALASLTSSA